MIDSQHLRQGDLAKVAPGEYRGLHGREGLGIESRPCQHAGDPPQGIPSSLTHCSGRGAGAVAQQSPSQSEYDAADDVCTQNGGLDRQLDQAEVKQQVGTHHGDDDAGQHELDDGHVLQQQGAQLLVVAQYPPLLQQKTKQNTGDQAIEQITHWSPPPYSIRAIIIPPIKKHANEM